MREIKFDITKAEEGAAFTVHVTAGASEKAVTSIDGEGTVHINLTTPTADGEANDILLRFLAEKLEVPFDAVEVAAGKSGHEKMIVVIGASPAAVDERLRR
ncbi:MAG TPA: DUF167 domain-containing protein [Anaerolineae bacterium]|nr:DUF167 domain-containing protein [Anaerolineae bacterium]